MTLNNLLEKKMEYLIACFLCLTLFLSFTLFFCNCAFLYGLKNYNPNHGFKTVKFYAFHYHFYQTLKLIRHCSKNKISYLEGIKNGLGSITN